MKTPVLRKKLLLHFNQTQSPSDDPDGLSPYHAVWPKSRWQTAGRGLPPIKISLRFILLPLPYPHSEARWAIPGQLLLSMARITPRRVPG